MTERYEEYYKIFGCGGQRHCDEKRAEADCCEKKEPCSCAVSDFTYQPADCNECIIENSGYAQAYVPYQESFNIFCPEEALCHGTIFQELVHPYSKKRYPEERCC